MVYIMTIGLYNFEHSNDAHYYFYECTPVFEILIRDYKIPNANAMKLYIILFLIGIRTRISYDFCSCSTSIHFNNVVALVLSFYNGWCCKITGNITFLR